MVTCRCFGKLYLNRDILENNSTLKNHFNGEWAVIIGHRAQYRSFHSVILENYNINNNQIYNDNQQQQIVQKVPLKINNKTNAEFINFGFGPKWFNWSIVVMQIEK